MKTYKIKMFAFFMNHSPSFREILDIYIEQKSVFLVNLILVAIDFSYGVLIRQSNNMSSLFVITANSMYFYLQYLKAHFVLECLSRTT